MLIYESEVRSGLKDALSNNTLSFATQIKPAEINVANLCPSVAEASMKDYVTLTSILASVGWNGNTDIFDGKELWRARKTAINKKLDFNHDEKDVIGTIIDSYAIDDDGCRISDDTDEDSLPDSFHVVNSSILWTFWKDETLKERMVNIIEEIANGEWFVSMEAIFNDFDYGVLTPDGRELVVARNKETAFLSKHLLQYGGAGEYEGHKLGRIIKDFTFVGKGITQKPANPKSVILSLANKGFKSDSTVDFYDFSIASVYSNDIKENEMSDELVKQLADAQKSLAALTEENAKLVAIVNEYNETKFKNIEAKLETVEASLVAEKEKVTSTEKAIETLKTRAEELEAENKALKDEQAQAAKNMKVQERKLALVKAGLDETKASEKALAWVDVDEAIFADYVAVIESTKAETKSEETETDTESTSASVLEDAEGEETVQETETDEEVVVSTKLKKFAKANLINRNGE